MTRPERMPPDRAPDETARTARDAAVHRECSRRGVLLAGLGALLAGCATNERTALRLPGPAWDAPLSVEPSVAESAVPMPAEPAPAGVRVAGVLPRSQWARGNPVPGLMNRMRPVRYVTVHHDGMSPFYGGDAVSAAARLELIRRAHRNKGWGDIGYHYAVDRAGRVWSARPVTYQGAHVRDHNEGNIGIVVLGNFDAQQPTPAQREALRRHLGLLTRSFGVDRTNVRTHMEWAVTACPGRHLQTYVDAVRAG